MNKGAYTIYSINVAYSNSINGQYQIYSVNINNIIGSNFSNTNMLYSILQYNNYFYCIFSLLDNKDIVIIGQDDIKSNSWRFLYSINQKLNYQGYTIENIRGVKNWE